MLEAAFLSALSRAEMAIYRMIKFMLHILRGNLLMVMKSLVHDRILIVALNQHQLHHSAEGSQQTKSGDIYCA